MKTGKRFKGGRSRYVIKKSSSKEMADRIKRKELFTGVMKVELETGLPKRKLIKLGDKWVPI